MLETVTLGCFSLLTLYFTNRFRGLEIEMRMVVRKFCIEEGSNLLRYYIFFLSNCYMLFLSPQR